MNKTLHQNLTSKHHYTRTSDHEVTGLNKMFSISREEIDIMRELSKDLLSPRQQAINRLMEISRGI